MLRKTFAFNLKPGVSPAQTRLPLVYNASLFCVKQGPGTRLKRMKRSLRDQRSIYEYPFLFEW